MNEPPSMTVGGLIIPWPESMGTKPTTWFVKLGVFPSSEKIFFKESLDYGIQELVPWAEEHWMPLFGKVETIHGSTPSDRVVRGGPATIRGIMTPGTALRVDIVYGTGVEIPIHAQVGNSSYVGVISTKMGFNFVIDEETTLEDVLKDC